MTADSKDLESSIKKALINSKVNAYPMTVRLAWHASGTFDDNKHTTSNTCNSTTASGGSDGATMRFAPESTDGANAGLGIMRDILLEVKDQHPDVSIADIWTMAGAHAIALTGGHRVPHSMGRTDEQDNSKCPANGRLPDASQGAAHLRDVFYRMGFNDEEIVALSGAHTLGRCHVTRSGFDGPWTTDPLTFDNEYLKIYWNGIGAFENGMVPCNTPMLVLEGSS